MQKYKILSTKKLDPLLVEKAKQNGIDILEEEFISITPIWSEKIFNRMRELHTIPYIVFTSQNAVRPVAQYVDNVDNFYIADWKIFCLSGNTMQTIASAGWSKNIIQTADNASELAQKIIDHGVKEIVFFCGNNRRDELPEILNKAGVAVHELIVYQTIETPVKISDEIDGIFFFSPSAVNSFFSINQLKDNTVCFAIGKTTAERIAHFSSNKIIVSESPSQDMILMEAYKFLKP